MAKAKDSAAPIQPPESKAPLAPDTTQKQAGAGQINALRITAKREGFRRAGRAWSMTPTDVLLDDLTDDQIKMLQAETVMLTVEEVVLP